MKAIRKMEPAWKKIAASNFRLGTYKDANGQLRPCYQLTKTECLYIATKFIGEGSESPRQRLQHCLPKQYTD